MPPIPRFARRGARFSAIALAVSSLPAQASIFVGETLDKVADIMAIVVLIIVPIVFGGLLWPIAWLWAFTKPVAYRVAYGTDKAAEWHEEMGEKAKAGELLDGELEHLRHELDAMAARGALPPKL